METVHVTAGEFQDRFDRTWDDEGWYATANDGSGLSIMVVKHPDVESSMFMRRVIKPGQPDLNHSLLVGQLDGVFLYVTEEGKFILTKEGELR